jgi:hypothetical protein
MSVQEAFAALRHRNYRLSGTIAEHFSVPAGAAFGASVAFTFALFLMWRAPYLRKLV